MAKTQNEAAPVVEDDGLGEIPDEALFAAARHLHQEHGPLFQLKRLPRTIEGLNARRQLVVTSIETAVAHGRKVGAAGLKPFLAAPPQADEPPPVAVDPAGPQTS